jgi:hypothetical protein
MVHGARQFDTGPAVHIMNMLQIRVQLPAPELSKFCCFVRIREVYGHRCNSSQYHNIFDEQPSRSCIEDSISIIQLESNSPLSLTQPGPADFASISPNFTTAQAKLIVGCGARCTAVFIVLRAKTSTDPGSTPSTQISHLCLVFCQIGSTLLPFFNEQPILEFNFIPSELKKILTLDL